MVRAKIEPIGAPRACRCAQRARDEISDWAWRCRSGGFRGPEFDSPRLHHTQRSRTAARWRFGFFCDDGMHTYVVVRNR